MHESVNDPAKKFVTPNLTPHPRWGWIASWPEEVFVARVHMGKQREGTPMPWHAFQGMHDDDLRAIYRYLRTLPPVEGGPDPGVQDAVVATGQVTRSQGGRRMTWNVSLGSGQASDPPSYLISSSRMPAARSTAAVAMLANGAGQPSDLPLTDSSRAARRNSSRPFGPLSRTVSVGSR